MSVSVCPSDELAGVENTGFRTVQTTVGAPVSLKCSDPGSQDRSRGSPCWVREDPAGGQAAVTSRGHRSVHRGHRSPPADYRSVHRGPRSPPADTGQSTGVRGHLPRTQVSSLGQRSPSADTG